MMFVLMIALKGMVHGYPELKEYTLSYDDFNRIKSKPATSILRTNENVAFSNVFDMPVPIKIYEVRLMVYSQWFADMYGYPNDYVVDMPKGLHAMQFQMITRGVQISTTFHLLLDNTLGLDLPSQNMTVRYNNPMRFPKELKDEDRVQWWKTDKERSKKQRKLSYYQSAQDKIRSYYSLNTRIATLDYDPKAKRGGSAAGSLLMYRNDYYLDMDYVQLHANKYFKKLWGHPDASIWIKKKGGTDYRKRLWPIPEEFMKFKIPDELRKQMLQLVDEISGLKSYSDYDDIYNGYQKKIEELQEGKHE